MNGGTQIGLCRVAIEHAVESMPFVGRMFNGGCACFIDEMKIFREKLSSSLALALPDKGAL